MNADIILIIVGIFLWTVPALRPSGSPLPPYAVLIEALGTLMVVFGALDVLVLSFTGHRLIG